MLGNLNSGRADARLTLKRRLTESLQGLVHHRKQARIHAFFSQGSRTRSVFHRRAALHDHADRGRAAATSESSVERSSSPSPAPFSDGRSEEAIPTWPRTRIPTPRPSPRRPMLAGSSSEQEELERTPEQERASAEPAAERQDTPEPEYTLEPQDIRIGAPLADGSVYFASVFVCHSRRPVSEREEAADAATASITTTLSVGRSVVEATVTPFDLLNRARREFVLHGRRAAAEEEAARLSPNAPDGTRHLTQATIRLQGAQSVVWNEDEIDAEEAADSQAAIPRPYQRNSLRRPVEWVEDVERIWAQGPKLSRSNAMTPALSSARRYGPNSGRRLQRVGWRTGEDGFACA